MMALELNDQLYETSASYITYAKIFPHIMADFLTRQDAKFLVASSNIVVTVNPGQAVTTTGTPVAQAGATISPGTGLSTFVYMGDVPTAGTKLLEASVKVRKEAGGLAIEGVRTAVEVVAGG